MSVLDLARAELRRVVDDLREVRYRLVGVQASIPPSIQDTSVDDLDADLDAPTEIRAVLSGCLNDCLDPLLRDLSSAADYQPGEPPSGKPEKAGDLGGFYVEFDIHSGSEAMQRVLYGLVVKDSFAPQTIDDPPGEIWVPYFTAEQAGLQVVFLWGRWFAAWKKLEVPGDLPERERWEVLRLDEDSKAPGTLFFDEV